MCAGARFGRFGREVNLEQLPLARDLVPVHPKGRLLFAKADWVLQPTGNLKIDRATCEKLRGLKPNIIAVDFYDRGDVVGVSKELNGIPAEQKPSVRTSP